MIIGRILLITCCLSLTAGLQGQVLEELSLSDAYTKLESRYPALQNSGIIEEIHRNDLALLDIIQMPSLALRADGRLQSESTHLNAEEGMTPIEIDLPLFSLKSYVEAQYQILDGGIQEAKIKIKEAQHEQNKQSIEVQRYSLQNQVNQLFTAVPLFREQITLLDISLQNLNVRKERMQANVEYGIALQTELTKIEVRELELHAQKDDLIRNLEGFINTLSHLIGSPLSRNVKLILPPLPAPLDIPKLNRPEQKLFELQRTSILAKSDLLQAEKRPKLQAFAQAGIGYPNPVNILDNGVAPFAIVGLGFTWKIADWGKQKIDQGMLTLQAQKVANDQATFEFNIRSLEANYLAEINRLSGQLDYDQRIVQLQADILKQLADQLDEGIITSSDYINQLNSELAARQKVLIHEKDLIRTQLSFWNQQGSVPTNN